MYKEYISKWTLYKNQYGEQTCLFYMVGKFYELYDIVDTKTGQGQTNVKQAVEALGITLTTRENDGPKGEDCYFAGFPEQSLQKFAGILTREGWTVVVCDQEKNGLGKVTGRPISRIFSPGTHIELAGTDAPYLAGIWFQEVSESAPRFAVAVLDLTTGRLISFEGQCQGTSEFWSSDELVHFFQIHSPRETVIWWRGSLLGRPTEAILKRRCGLQKSSIHVESANADVQGSLEHPLVRKQFLESVFSKILCLLPIHEQLQIQKKLITERLIVSLLRFAEDHIPSAIGNLQGHTVWTPHTAVYMGNNTLSQLNYIATSSEQPVVQLFEKTLTSLGKRAMRERLLTPSSDVLTIQTRLKEVTCFYTMVDESSKQIEGTLRLVQDLSRLHRKILLYSVTATDILALDQSYGCAKDLQSSLSGTCLSYGEDQTKEFLDYLNLFHREFDVEKAKMALKQEDVSFLPKEKAPKTAEIEEKLSGKKAKIAELLEEIRQWVGLPPEAIRIESQDSFFTLTATKTTLGIIKKKLQSDCQTFPGMTIHEKKTSRGTIELPQLERYQYEVASLRNQLQASIKEELPVLCNAVQNPCWSYLEGWIAKVDVSLTLANVAKERGYVCPIIVESDDSGVEATGLRHPLLESIQTRREYVKHDVSLGFGSDTGWLLYGMNASGKSSLMKAIGVNVLLAQAGSYVAATSFQIKPFQSIFTRILNQDNLWAGLSSFAVEVSELRDMFEKADQRSLVLGDELCSGTESISATSLVAAGLQYLHRKHSRFVFATHLHDLNKLPSIMQLPHLGIWHLRVHYDMVTDTLVYDRTLHRGPGGTLYGLEVAKAMHLPHAILKQAYAFRRELLGEKSLEEAQTSSWNSHIIRKQCEICGSAIVRDLEVHHVKPRAEAEKGRFEDGTSMNSLQNLIVVCQACHDKHHAGEIHIGPEKQTSAGPKREIQTLAPKSTKVKVKWSEEEQQILENYLRKYPHLPIPRLVYDLKHNEDITISESSLRKLRASLS